MAKEPRRLEYPTLEGVFLSGIFHDPAQFPQVAGILTDGMFSVAFHRSVWNAFQYLYRNGSVIDTITVSGHLITTGVVNLPDGDTRKVLPEIEEIYNKAFNDKVPVLAYAQEIKGYAAMRDLVAYCKDAIDEAYESDNPDEVRASLIAGLLGIKTSSSDNLMTMADVDHEFQEQLDEDPEIRKSRIMDTGYKEVDYMVGGLPEATINVIVAYQKVGKSTFSTQMQMFEAETAGHASIIFSLEMPGKLVHRRLLQMHSGLPIKEIINGRHIPSPSELKRLSESREYIKSLPIHIVDKDCDTVAGIRSHIHQFRAKNPHLDLRTVQIDHFHLLDTGDYKDEMTGMNKNVGQLLGLTRETGVRILLPAQLKDPVVNQYKKNAELPPPKMHDLRFAKTLIDAAYNIIAIHRPNMYTHNGSGPEACEVRLLASRDSSKSGSGVAKIQYNHKRGSFHDNNEDSHWFLGKVKEYSGDFWRSGQKAP